MVLRADDFRDRSMFLTLVEEAQGRGLVRPGPLSWDEGDSVVDLDDFELIVRPEVGTGAGVSKDIPT